ncbi:MAG: SsrA-binding protein SmpB [Lachnospiraceae bacterium]|nr:SsrA-binding protein SmpB [Lachnospiraceae bacterium]MDN4742559.1 SsrA-binding protein SmpB [Lachnospiraceae bacterium C1.1]
MPNKKDDGRKIVANNKKAFYDYFIEDKLEVGIELAGTEVKSIRMGKVSIKEAYVSVVKGELVIDGMNITPYEKGNIFNKDPLRTKRLLAHKNEILKFEQKLNVKGYTILPLSVYFKNGRVKLEIGLGKGKKIYDKRESIAKKDAQREAEKDFRIKMKV